VKYKSPPGAGLPFASEPAMMSPMKHNSYFDGKVQSLAVDTSEGPATAGVIEPGKYTFKTDSEERMRVVAGTLKAKLPGAEWQTFASGQSFVVPAHAAFDVEAAADVAYLCHYKK
jgi:purine/pyrimidine-nucleoside phosphorylase